MRHNSIITLSVIALLVIAGSAFSDPFTAPLNICSCGYRTDPKPASYICDCSTGGILMPSRVPDRVSGLATKTLEVHWGPAGIIVQELLTATCTAKKPKVGYWIVLTGTKKHPETAWLCVGTHPSEKRFVTINDSGSPLLSSTKIDLRELQKWGTEQDTSYDPDKTANEVRVAFGDSEVDETVTIASEGSVSSQHFNIKQILGSDNFGGIFCGRSSTGDADSSLCSILYASD